MTRRRLLCSFGLGISVGLLGMVVVVFGPNATLLFRSSKEKADGNGNVGDVARDRFGETWDAGIVHPNRTLSRTFTLYNDSDHSWTFKNDSSCCGSRIKRVHPHVIAPKESAEIEVELRTPADASLVRHEVDVRFEGPGAPLWHLVVEAAVREPLTVSPTRVQLGRVTPTCGAIGTFVLETYTDHPVAIVAVEATDTLHVQWEPVESRGAGDFPGNVWRFRVTPDVAGLSPGYHVEQINIRTDSPDHTALQVPVVFSLPKPLEVVPDRLFFGSIHNAESASARLSIRVMPEGGPVDFDDFDLCHTFEEELRVKIRPTTSTTLFVLDAQMIPQGREGPVTGMLTVRIPRLGFHPVAIPIRAWVE